MGARFDLIREFALVENNEVKHPDDISVTPRWVVCVVRLAHPVTFSRAKMASFTTDSSVAAQTRGDPLIITEDCVQLVARSDKSSYLHSLQAELLGARRNYQAEVLSGDWVLAWMLNDDDRYNDLLARIKVGKPCNEWEDGLKFVGRVASVHEVVVNDRGTGNRSTRYQLQGVGFEEFSSSVYYDPHLAENHAGLSTWLGKLDKAISEFIEHPGGDENDRAGISINKAIPFFMDLLLGDGITRRFANPGGEPALQIGTGAGSGQAPFAYLVPKEVGDLLGKTSRDVSKACGILAYADLVELLYGVQRYQGTAGASDRTIFTPDGVQRGGQGLRRFTGKPMLGLFTPDIPDFTGKQVWAVMSQYLNQTVNEMFTCLRVNADGKVVPTVVLRQMPFSSMPMVRKKTFKDPLNADGEFGPAEGPPQELPELTPFLELPRWRLHESLFWERQLGRSNSLRFNFVQIIGRSPMAQRNNEVTYQVVRNPPIRDDLDIQRSGLRPYQATVACSYREAREGPRAMMEICADWLMGMHLTQTGTVNCLGITAPICVGDNLETGDTVAHIESVVHACTHDVNSGTRDFTTSMNLTHGVRSDSAPGWTEEDEVLMYAGVLVDDQKLGEVTFDGPDDRLTDQDREKRTAEFDRTLKAAMEARGEQPAGANRRRGFGPSEEP